MASDSRFENIATHADVALLKADIVSIRADLQVIKWAVGLLLLIDTGMLAALVQLLMR